MTDHELVLTPEKVVIAFRTATIGTRAVGFILDLVFMGVILVGIQMIMSFAAFGGGQVLADSVFGLIAAFSPFLYFSVQEAAFRGQTLGKKIMRIRVMMTDGTPITLRGAVFRSLLFYADFAAGFGVVALLTAFINPRSQRVGDLVAGTMVVQDPRPFTQFSPSPHRAGIHRMEQTLPELEAMTMEEYYALKRLTDRFPELTASVQERSIQEVWDPFAAKHGIDRLHNVHPIYQLEAVIMKYGRKQRLI